MASARNALIADRLGEAALLLEQQQANRFRVAAYRHAGEVVRHLDRDLAEIAVEGGRAALEALPGIGRSIAGAIAEMLRSGRWGFLDHLRGSADPELLLLTLPGVGPKLARRLHEALPVDRLEALETALHEGTLDYVPGLGPRRRAMLRAALAQMMARARPLPGHGRPDQGQDEPALAVLLEIDREYRQKAAAAALPTIAPRRFNPKGEAWLPILHAERPPWRFTVLFSNTQRAHDLHRVRDWVVIYFHADHGPEGQRTVVTETRGIDLGRRVVRGREAECHVFYGSAGAGDALAPESAPRPAGSTPP